MKYLLLFVLFLSAECHALFIVNECENQKDINSFSALYNIKIDNYEFENKEIHQSWLIEIPIKYKEYGFRSLTAKFKKNGKFLFETYLETEIEENKYISALSVNKAYENNIKLTLIYSNQPIGLMDAPVCSFVLNKHNKSFKSGTPKSGAP